MVPLKSSCQIALKVAKAIRSSCPHQRLRSVCDFGLKIQGTKCLKQNKKQQIKETFVLKMKY